MAGFYSDAPAPRMAYDIDGTVMSIVYPSGSIVVRSAAERRNMNDEVFDQPELVGKNTAYLTFIFPQFRDITHYSLWGGNLGGSNGRITTSTDTTNGYDGTWTDHGLYALVNANKAALREEIKALTLSGIKAIRFGVTGNLNGGSQRPGLVHLYGGIAAGQTPDRLRMWHPTLDEPLDDNTSTDGAHLDWADIAQGTTADKQFRIKNNSATLTANSIVVSTEVLTDTSPALGGQITYSDGGPFASTVTIPSLAPGALSPVLTVRRSTDVAANLGLWWLRTFAEAGSWS